LHADVARDAADIVLMDDEFPSIVNAIEEGRVIYDNLKKTIAYTLAHAVPEVLPLFLNLVLNFPLGEQATVCSLCQQDSAADMLLFAACILAHMIAMRGFARSQHCCLFSAVLLFPLHAPVACLLTTRCIPLP
jgi:hypothetical protein